MKRVFSSHDRVLVHHFRNLLQAEGIRAVVRNEFLASAMGELPPAECQAEVWVLNESDLLLAEKILQARKQPLDPVPWNCSCGERQEPQFTHCWRCGAARP